MSINRQSIDTLPPAAAADNDDVKWCQMHDFNQAHAMRFETDT